MYPGPINTLIDMEGFSLITKSYQEDVYMQHDEAAYNMYPI